MNVYTLVVYIFREQENVILRDHIQSNIDNFLTKHPNAMVIVTRDFNPTSTGLDPKSLCIPNHLTQLVKFYTRDTDILDWFCTNMPHLFHLQRLPKVATSDHYTILARPLVTPTPKEDSIGIGLELGSVELVTVHKNSKSYHKSLTPPWTLIYLEIC